MLAVTRTQPEPETLRSLQSSFSRQRGATGRHDFAPDLALGLVYNAGEVRPLYRAYQLLATVLAADADRLIVDGYADGGLGGGMGAILATRDGSFGRFAYCRMASFSAL